MEQLCQILVVGDHQHGGSQIVDLLQQRHDFKGALRVQIAGRLVGDDGGRIVHQRAGNGKSLLLAAGHLIGMAVHLAFQTDQLQHVGNPLFDLGLLRAHDPHGKGHVLIDRHFFDQAVILKHDADRAAQVGNFALANSFQRIAVDVDGAGGGLQLAGDELDDGGLTGTGRTDQEAELAVLDLHGNAVEGLVTLRIGFYNISKFNHIRIFLPS